MDKKLDLAQDDVTAPARVHRVPAMPASYAVMIELRDKRIIGYQKQVQQQQEQIDLLTIERAEWREDWHKAQVQISTLREALQSLMSDPSRRGLLADTVEKARAALKATE